MKGEAQRLALQDELKSRMTKKKKKKSMRLYADYSLDNRQGVGIEIYVLGSFFLSNFLILMPLSR